MRQSTWSALKASNATVGSLGDLLAGVVVGDPARRRVQLERHEPVVRRRGERAGAQRPLPDVGRHVHRIVEALQVENPVEPEGAQVADPVTPPDEVRRPVRGEHPPLDDVPAIFRELGQLLEVAGPQRPPILFDPQEWIEDGLAGAGRSQEVGGHEALRDADGILEQRFHIGLGVDAQRIQDGLAKTDLKVDPDVPQGGVIWVFALKQQQPKQ